MAKVSFLTLLFTLSSLISFQCAQAEVHSKLQWFDAHGEIMDLDWTTTIQWVWSQEKTPAAQVIITIPNQLNFLSSDETQAKFVSGVPDREGKSTNRTLVVEMEGPRKTIKLKKLEPNQETREIGLTIILSTDTPNVVPSESCAKEGVAIEPRQAESNFLFLAASCKMLPSGLRISLETSNDATLGKDTDETLIAHSSEDPLVILIAKKDLEDLKADTLLETVRAQSDSTPPVTTQFELVYTKDSVAKVSTPRTGKMITHTETAKALAKKTWTFTWGGSLGFLGYTGLQNNPGLDPSEEVLSGQFTAEHSLFGSSTHFKGLIDAPLLTLMPAMHFPASGLYEAQGRVSFTIFDRGKIALHFEPGIEFNEAQFQNRTDVSGFYYGPELGAYLNGTLGFLGNRGAGIFITGAPLLGKDTSPFLSNWDIASELSVEMIKGDPGKRWDLLLRFRYLNLESPSFGSERSTETSLGIRTGF